MADLIRDKRKKAKRRKVVGISILSFVVVLGAMVLVAFKVFTVQEVVVTGNTTYSAQAIRDWVLNDEHSWNTLYVFFKYRFQEPKEIPFVESMEVVMKDPHTIGIQVYEKGMLGYVNLSNIGQNAYFDQEGFVVETSSQILEGIPQINGLPLDQVVLYEKLPIHGQHVLMNMLSVTQMLKKYELLPKVIDFGEDHSFSLEYPDIKVLLGQYENMNDKVLRLAYIKPSLEGRSGVLRLESWAENATDITFEQSQ